MARFDNIEQWINDTDSITQDEIANALQRDADDTFCNLEAGSSVIQRLSFARNGDVYVTGTVRIDGQDVTRLVRNMRRQQWQDELDRRDADARDEHPDQGGNA